MKRARCLVHRPGVCDQHLFFLPSLSRYEIGRITAYLAYNGVGAARPEHDRVEARSQHDQCLELVLPHGPSLLGKDGLSGGIFGLDDDIVAPASVFACEEEASLEYLLAAVDVGELEHGGEDSLQWTTGLRSV